MVESLFWSILEWPIRAKVFSDVSISVLSLYWYACFQGGCSLRHAIQLTWICPSKGILKLNVDGSFG